MESVPESKTVYILLFLTNNHLSNVKSLQSIYRQNYDNIFLIAYNNCTSHFESDRFNWNLENGRGSNIRQVIFDESPYQLDEYTVLRKYWNRMDDGLTIALHAGEYFKSNSSVSECAAMFAADYPDAVLAPCACYTNDMKKVVSTIKVKETGWNTPSFRDCMVMARTRALQSVHVEFDVHEQHVMRLMLEQMEQQEYIVLRTEKVLCTYSVASTNPLESPLPDSLVDEKLRAICEQYRSQKSETDPPLLSTKNSCAFVPSEQQVPLLERLVTLKRIKDYLLLTLAMLLTGGLFMLLKQPALQTIAWVILGLGGACAVWTASAVIINLLFKHKKRKGLQL